MNRHLRQGNVFLHEQALSALPQLLFLHSDLYSTEWAMEQENLFTQISFFLIIYDNFVLNFNIHYFAFYDCNGSCPYHVNDTIGHYNLGFHK